MIEVYQIDKHNGLITFKTDQGSVMINGDKIIKSVGFITPAEIKTMFKTFHSIINEQYIDIDAEIRKDYEAEIMSGLSLNT